MPMFLQNKEKWNKKMSTTTRFELVRAEPSNLAGYRLNHSATLSLSESEELMTACKQG